MSIPQNIERRIKQHIKGKEHSFYAIYPPGFEATGLGEMKSVFPGKEFIVEKGGIAFDGTVNDCYVANLQLRGAVRVLMRVDVFKALFFEKLHDKIQAIPWELYLDESRAVSFNVSCRHSRLYHTGRIEEECARAVTEKMKSVYENYNPLTTPAQEIHVRFADDICMVSLDSSGESLYLRKYKKLVSRAPLRENIASLILRESKIENYDILLDPMCGSGTFSLEAALLCGAGHLVHPEREFAFQNWPVFSPGGFEFLKKEQSALRTKKELKIFAGDIDDKSVHITLENARACGVDENAPVRLNAANADFFTLKRNSFPEGKILLAMNPPYGKRLGDDGETLSLYREIGKKITNDFSDAGFAIIAPGHEAQRALGLHYDRKIPFMNGGIPAAVLFGDI